MSMGSPWYSRGLAATLGLPLAALAGSPPWGPPARSRPRRRRRRPGAVALAERRALVVGVASRPSSPRWQLAPSFVLAARVFALPRWPGPGIRRGPRAAAGSVGGLACRVTLVAGAGRLAAGGPRRDLGLVVAGAERVLLLGQRREVRPRPRARTPSSSARPASGLRSLPLPAVALAAALVAVDFVARCLRADRRAVAGRGVEDRVDEVGLAEAGDALDAHRAGDRVELLTVLAVEHRPFELLLGHVVLLGLRGRSDTESGGLDRSCVRQSAGRDCERNRGRDRSRTFPGSFPKGERSFRRESRGTHPPNGGGTGSAS